MDTIKVVSKNDQSLLFECHFESSDQAYQYASEMELLGIDVEIVLPSLCSSFMEALDLCPEEKIKYQKSMEDEMENHQGSCCYSPKS